MLSWTWGLPLTLIGYIVSLILTALGYHPYRYRKNFWCFELGERWGGLNLGPFLLVQKNADYDLKNHEVGHAIQDKEGYSFMRFRSMMFPLVRFSSYGGYIAILVGALFGLMDLIWFGIGLEIVILLFQIITLPVEFNASSRAKDELAKYNLLNNNEINSSDKMLRAAAYTYVASVLTTILQILRLIVMFSDRDN